MLLTLGGGLVCLAICLPLFYLFVRSLEGGLARYLETTFSVSTAKLLWQTLALVGGVGLLSLAISLLLAWLVASTDLKARRVWAVAAALPLASCWGPADSFRAGSESSACRR